MDYRCPDCGAKIDIFEFAEVGYECQFCAANAQNDIAGGATQSLYSQRHAGHINDNSTPHALA